MFRIVGHWTTAPVTVIQSCTLCWYCVLELCTVTESTDSQTYIHGRQTVCDWIWLLHLGEPYVRRKFDPNAPGLMGLQWDKAELFEVSSMCVMSLEECCFSVYSLAGSLANCHRDNELRWRFHYGKRKYMPVCLMISLWLFLCLPGYTYCSDSYRWRTLCFRSSTM